MRLDNYIEAIERREGERREDRRAGRTARPVSTPGLADTVSAQAAGQAVQRDRMEAVALQQQISAINRDVIQYRALTESPEGWQYRAFLLSLEAQLQALEELQRVLLNPT